MEGQIAAIAAAVCTTAGPAQPGLAVAQPAGEQDASAQGTSDQGDDDKNDAAKGPWTHEVRSPRSPCRAQAVRGVAQAPRTRKTRSQEDQELLRLVQKHGPRNWSQLCRGIPGRSGKSCRLRCVRARLTSPTKWELHRCACGCGQHDGGGIGTTSS